MKSIVVRDVRLEGWRPNGDFVLEVDRDTPIAWFFHWTKAVAETNGPDVVLKIMCHGHPGELQLCSEGLNSTNVHLMTYLSGKLKGIELYACEVARITPGSDATFPLHFFGWGPSDGNYFCYRMAQFAQTTVKASTANQFYNTGADGRKTINFDNWEGAVLTYGPQGNLARVE